MGQLRGRVVVVGVLAVLAISVGALLGRVPGQGHGAPRESSSPTSQPTERRESVQVHVSGMVVSPGVVVVPEGAIVADVIDAAGGLRSGAAVDHLNLAAPVSPGDQVVVPGPEATPATGGGAGDGIISLSRATAEELESLPGVGPVLAERLVSFREENGGFDTVEDLLEVPGIGEAKLAAMRDLVRP